MTSIFSLKPSDYENIDDRLKPFLTGWSAVESYKGQTVNFPGTWNSKIFPYRYFEVIKKPGDPNYDPNEAENEICLCLWAGWKEGDDSGAYDDELDIRLWIRGKDVLDRTKKKVSAEIFKTAGAPITLYYKGKQVTNFTKTIRKKHWWREVTEEVPVDKVWIEDMNIFS